MKSTLLIAVMALWPTLAFSLGFPQDPRTVPVFINLAEGHGAGSGFLLRLSNSVYVITAKHVLFEPPEGTNVAKLRAPRALLKTFSYVTRAGAKTNLSERILVLGLEKLLAAGEIRFSTNRDVALIRIEEPSPANANMDRILSGVSFLTPEGSLEIQTLRAVCPLKKIEVAADVLMFGYPVALTGRLGELFDPTEPLLRKGIVAGINMEKKTVIIDCPSYSGNSGGPVLQVGHPSSDATDFKIIGIVSGFIPFEEEWENKTMKYSHVIKSNSGYTVIEPIDIALDLVWK
jgi:hypothetical protein